jgi:hypothetical protein
VGVNLPTAGVAWVGVSDVNKKENLMELQYADILEKVDTMPIYEYNYKETPAGLKCRGPTAQDWHTRFPSDKDPLGIDTMDLDGITLAALKGLYTHVKVLQARIDALENA